MTSRAAQEVELLAATAIGEQVAVAATDCVIYRIE